MDNVINITQTKDNTIELDVKVEGISTNEMTVLLIMHLEKFCLSFKCENVGSDKWRVNIPPLPFIERSAYPFNIAVIADGYHFEPYKGTINIVTTADIYVSMAKTPIGPSKSEPTQAPQPEVVIPSTSTKEILDRFLRGEPKPEKKEETKEEKKEEPKAEKKDEKKEEKKPSLLKDIIPRKPKAEKKEEVKESNLDSAASSPLNIEDQKVRDILDELKKKKKAADVKKAPTAKRII